MPQPLDASSRRSPSFQLLLERYQAGRQGKREIVRRVAAADLDRLPEAEQAAALALAAVVDEKGWGSK